MNLLRRDRGKKRKRPFRSKSRRHVDNLWLAQKGGGSGESLLNPLLLWRGERGGTSNCPHRYLKSEDETLRCESGKKKRGFYFSPPAEGG